MANLIESLSQQTLHSVEAVMQDFPGRQWETVKMAVTPLTLQGH